MNLLVSDPWLKITTDNALLLIACTLRLHIVTGQSERNIQRIIHEERREPDKVQHDVPPVRLQLVRIDWTEAVITLEIAISEMQSQGRS